MPDPQHASPPPPSLSLRERKKAMTRAAIVSNARRLFDERGYADVTVAEIADASDVSVKTLFMYFNSKDDLYFDGESELCDEILGAVRDRPPGESLLDAVERHLLAFVGRGSYASLTELRDTVAHEPALRARLAVMWQDYEDRLAAHLVTETSARAEDPMPRLVASHVVALYRALAGDQVGRMVAARPSDPVRVLRAWVRASVATLRDGLAGYAPAAGE